MTFPMPTVIDKSRTVTLGEAGSFTKVTFSHDMVTQSQADVRSMLKGIAGEVTAQQIRMGNPPSLVEVDGRTNRPVDSVDKKVVVVFGQTLAAAAMAVVSAALRQAILSTTTSRSGRLSDVSSNWGWTFLSGGRAVNMTGANQLVSFGPDDRLILMPKRVPYATNANQAAVGTNRLSVKSRKGRASLRKKGSNLGFFAHAVQMIRRRPEFRQFIVYAAFTQAHKVPGELSKLQGSGMIVIRARRRTERR